MLGGGSSEYDLLLASGLADRYECKAGEELSEPPADCSAICIAAGWRGLQRRPRRQGQYVATDQAIYYPAAFDEYGLQALREHVPRLIPVERDEARRFACNAVVVGRTVITNTGCPQLHAALRAEGYDPQETPLDEFVKAGGSAKCLTLRLDGEEAAAWKRE